MHTAQGPYHWLAQQRLVAKTGVVHRHVAPAKDLHVVVRHHLCKRLLQLLPDALFAVEKQLRHGVVLGRREINALLREARLEERVRHVEQDTRAIARVLVATAGTAVLHAHQHFQGICGRAHSVRREGGRWGGGENVRVVATSCLAPAHAIGGGKRVSRHVCHPAVA